MLGQGKLDCEVPAVPVDLRLQIGDRIPIYLWNLSLERGQVLDLGALDLQQGASVAGWVETANGEPLPKGTEVVLLPPPHPGLGSQSRERLARQSNRAGVTDRGFFQVVGIPPGGYRLSARAGEFAVSDAETLVVREGLELRLPRPLVLERSLDFELVVDPPFGPMDTPWLLSLSKPKHGPYLPPSVARGTADLDGRWQIKSLRPGTYLVSVAAGEYRWLEEQIEVRRHGEQVLVQVPLKAVRGEIRLRGEPLQASLIFGGRNGPIQVPMETDEAGYFEGFLPRWGTWPLSVSSQDPRVERRLRRVKVLEPAEGLDAYVSLELGGGVIQGVVVDEEGEEIPGAMVAAISLPEFEPPVYVRSDDQGSFHLEGLDSASVVSLQATSGDAQSKWVRVDLEAVERQGGDELIELELRPSVQVGGVVSGPSGGVPGATVALWPTHTGYMEGTATDEHGTFSLKISARVEEVGSMDLVVMAPGYPLVVERRAAGTGRPLSVFVGKKGAGEIVVPLTPPEGPGFGAYLVLFEGIPLAIPVLGQWATLNGYPRLAPNVATLRVPQMPAGTYALCRVGMEVASNLDGVDSEAFGSCLQGILSADGVLHLDPSGEPQITPPNHPQAN